jgi:penicillin-binding protein 1A
MNNEINSADIDMMIDNAAPGAEGEDQGVGNENDFVSPPNNEYIPPESKPVIEDNDKNKKDTVNKKPAKDPKIGEPAPTDEKKKKGGFLRNLFKKKDST